MEGLVPALAGVAAVVATTRSPPGLRHDFTAATADTSGALVLLCVFVRTAVTPPAQRQEIIGRFAVDTLVGQVVHLQVALRSTALTRMTIALEHGCPKLLPAVSLHVAAISLALKGRSHQHQASSSLGLLTC